MQLVIRRRRRARIVQVEAKGMRGKPKVVQGPEAERDLGMGIGLRKVIGSGAVD